MNPQYLSHSEQMHVYFIPEYNEKWKFFNDSLVANFCGFYHNKSPFNKFAFTNDWPLHLGHTDDYPKDSQKLFNSC